MMIRRGTILLCVVALSASLVSAADWHQWRGPDRDGISKETGLLKSWPADGPTLVWRVQGLGGGMSSIAIANGHIYSMGQKGGQTHIVCRNVRDGSEVWGVTVMKVSQVFSLCRAESGSIRRVSWAVSFLLALRPV